MNALLDSIATLWLQNDSNLNCHPGTRLKAAVSIVILEQGRKLQSQLSSWNKAESSNLNCHPGTRLKAAISIVILEQG